MAAGGRIKGSYGIDAPYVPVISLLAAAGALVGAGFADGGVQLAWRLILGVLLALQGVIYLATTLWGKFALWERLLDRAGLTGREAVLDVGCGRGMVLITAARHLTAGRATGIDLWRSRDQSGNNPETTRANAVANGVGDRIELETGDMSRLPMADDTFDVVTANVAIQNLKDRALRRTTIEQIYRVTKPGGQILLVDIQYTRQYRDDLIACGATDVALRKLGPRGWFGNPFYASKLVSARKS